MAARGLAGGGRVEVLEEDPTGRAQTRQPGDAEPDDPVRAPADGLREHERLRTDQGGL